MLQAAEFFAGIGLMRRALETSQSGATWQTVFANDNDPMKHRIYRAFFRADHVLDERDVFDLSPADIPPVDLWTVSFPCTDVSIAGGRLGIRASQSGAVWKILNLLNDTPEEEKPRALLFENVMGLLSSHRGADIRSLVEAINKMGYFVDALRVDAKHFVPQSRQRLFLVATPRESAPVAAPSELVETPYRPAAILNVMRANQDLDWHARRMPDFPRRRRKLAQLIEKLPDDDPRWWNATRTTNFRRQIHPNHKHRIERWIRNGEEQYATAFRRVRTIDGEKRCVAEARFDEIAGCLRTPKGGSAKQILVRTSAGRLFVRHLTPVECLRLQGWDRKPPKNISDDEMLFALGDAVCVPAVQWVSRHALTPTECDTVRDQHERLFATA